MQRPGHPQLLANIGLGFLFLLAGYELDPLLLLLLRQRPGELAIGGWLISAVLAVGVAAGLSRASCPGGADRRFFTCWR